MNNHNFPVRINDVPIIDFLSINDIHNLCLVSKNTLEFVNKRKYIMKDKFNKCATIIQNFFKYSNTLFKLSESLDSEILYTLNSNLNIFKKFKFITINLMYMKFYNLKNANDWIRGCNVQWKSNTIKNYIQIDVNKTYNKYDLNKLLTQMEFDDIFYIGF